MRAFLKTICYILIAIYLGGWHLCAAAPASDLAKLNLIELKQQTNQTVLIFTLKHAAIPTFSMLSDPDRLVIDLPNTLPSSLLPRKINSNGLIQNIRLGYGPDGIGNIRLIIDLATKIEFVYLVDSNTANDLQKITLILRPVDSNATVTIPKEPASIEDLAHTTSTTQEVHTLAIAQAANMITQGATGSTLHASTEPEHIPTPIKVMQANKVMVMIDPGHGGKDSGAIGSHGIMEKNVVLAICKKLQADLLQSQGINAKLTRTGDYFISLRKRINIARQNKANIFIAVHADAFKNNDAQGASVFALSQHGATSEAARWLADRENTSELSGISMKDKGWELKSVLIDMAQTATIHDSLKLGNNMLIQLKAFTPLHANHVEQAAFVVLKSPDIPSILVETGFITNPEEEKLLSNPDYQAQVAQALANGIMNYFKQNPPPDTWFETQYHA